MAKTALGLILLLGVSAAPARAVQDPDAEPPRLPLACAQGAVTVDVSSAPSISIVPLEKPGRLGYTDGHEFTLVEGPFERVRVALWATIPEARIGRASEAQLGIYLQTTMRGEGDAHARMRWWQVIPDPAADSLDGPAHSFVVDANRLHGCFPSAEETDCSFATVERAVPDSTVPLLAVSFTQDFGGANANNWADAVLVLDFRSAMPRAAATIDCSYNEGGGACTAYDSGTMPRSTFACEWVPGEQDALCREEQDAWGAHRSFYLLSGRPAPLEPAEVSSLAEAVPRLQPGGEVVQVRGLGVVEHLAALPDGTGLLIASSAGFHLAAGGAVLDIPIGELPDPLTRESAQAEDTPPRQFMTAAEKGWTAGGMTSLSARVLHRQRGLTIYQVVETVYNRPSSVYWVGVDTTASGPRADALVVAGGNQYAGCGMTRDAASILSPVRFRSPFKATAALLPQVTESLDEELRWYASQGYEDASPTECLARVTIAWRDGRFHVESTQPACAEPIAATAVSIAPDGTTTLAPRGGGAPSH